jgi:hypothetical protein
MVQRFGPRAGGEDLEPVQGEEVAVAAEPSEDHVCLFSYLEPFV